MKRKFILLALGLIMVFVLTTSAIQFYYTQEQSYTVVIQDNSFKSLNRSHSYNQSNTSNEVFIETGIDEYDDKNNETGISTQTNESAETDKYQNLDTLTHINSDFYAPEAPDQSTKITSVPLVRESQVTDLKCMPYSYGTGASNDRKIYGYRKKYKTCVANKDRTISYEQGQIKLNCGKGNLNEFIPGYDRSLELFGKINIKFTSVPSPRGSYENIEYFYMKCNTNYELVDLRNVYNPVVAQSAIDKTSELLKAGKNTDKKKPLTVVTFIIDSVSRQSFYRNLQETVNYFNEKIANSSPDSDYNYLIYDFLFTNAIEGNILSNIAPILFGKSLEAIRDQLNNREIDNDQDKKFFEEIEQESIWSYYKNKGFTTMFLFETVEDYLSTLTGRNITADHIVSNFWHLCSQKFFYSDFSERFQCLGNYPAHYYSLKYLYEYLENYKGINRFAYIHLSVAHESSGRRLHTIDRDLRLFFDKIFNLYRNIDEDIVFAFLADHGRAKTSPIPIESKAEILVPFFFLISNEELIKSLNSHKIIQENTGSLVSRYDIHNTLKFLANYHYNHGQSESNTVITEYPSFNLLKERVPKNRTCSDAGIPYANCMCSAFYDLDPAKWAENYAIHYFVAQTIKNFNQVNSKRIRQKACREIELGNVTRTQTFEIDPNDEFAPVHYKIDFFTTGLDPIQVYGTVASAEKYIKTDSFSEIDSHTRYLYTDSHGNSMNVIAKIWDVIRLDHPSVSVTDSVCNNKNSI